MPPTNQELNYANKHISYKYQYKNEPNSKNINLHTDIQTKLISADIKRQIINKIQINKQTLTLVIKRFIKFYKNLNKTNKFIKLTSLFISNQDTK